MYYENVKNFIKFCKHKFFWMLLKACIPIYRLKNVFYRSIKGTCLHAVWMLQAWWKNSFDWLTNYMTQEKASLSKRHMKHSTWNCSTTLPSEVHKMVSAFWLADKVMWLLPWWQGVAWRQWWDLGGHWSRSHDHSWRSGTCVYTCEWFYTVVPILKLHL